MDFNKFIQLFNTCPYSRTTITEINISDIAVLTYSTYLDNAISYFQKQQNKLPNFIIIDWDGNKNFHSIEKLSNLKTQYKINFFPYTKKDKIPQKKYCAFSLLDPITYTNNFCIVPLILECYQKGFKENLHILKTVYDYIGYGICNYMPYIFNRMNDVFTIYNKLEDEESKKTFLHLIKGYCTGKPDFIYLSDYPQYFHPIVSPSQSDKVIIDGGSLNGDTSIDFAKNSSSETQIFSFEPVPSLYEKCVKNTNNYKNIKMIPYALWDKSEKFYIENQDGASSISKEQTSSAELCNSIALDEFYEKYNINDCSLIKLDIEKAEPNALEGAKQIIQKYHPKLQISIYHTIDQLLDIPLYIMNTYPEYKLFIGHHTISQIETVLYAAIN